jgi:drug/metabolite transporter (DMT)-like permease
MGIVGMSIPSVMLAYGVSLSLVSNSFLLQVEAIYSMILSYILLKERISKKQVLLSVLSFLGMALVLTEGVIRPINIGDLLFLSTPLFYQFAHIVAKDILKTIDPTVVVMYRFLIGGLTLFLVSVLFGLNPLDFSRTFQGTLIVLYMGFGYAIGNSLWYYGIKHINLSKGTSMIIMYPLISTILAILTLGETITAIKVVGILLVFLSTLILSRVKSVSRN